MVNPKRKKISNAISKISKDQLGNEDSLSSDLAQKVGNLSEKSKVTIRLDKRIIEEAKKESERLGIGYQKIINDRLAEIYDLDKSIYLDRSLKNALKELDEMKLRIESLEKKEA